MTAFEQWLQTTVAALIPDPEHAPSCAAMVGGECGCGMIPSTLEQRLAIGLVQARALELRNMATELQMKGFNQNPPGAYLFTRMWERSHKLEQIGLELCKAYPPSEPEEAGPRLVQ